jgi:hypothetical protein
MNSVQPTKRPDLKRGASMWNSEHLNQNVTVSLRLELPTGIAALINEIVVEDRVFVPRGDPQVATETVAVGRKSEREKKVPRGKAISQSPAKGEKARCESCGGIYTRRRCDQRFCKSACGIKLKNNHGSEAARPRRGRKPGPKPLFGAAGADNNIDAPRSRDSLLDIKTLRVPMPASAGRSGD